MRVWLIFAAFLLIVGCREDRDNSIVGEDRVGGPCRYVEVPGVAVITSIGAPDSGSYNCSDAVKVLFDFTPRDPSAPRKYVHSYWPDTGQHLTVGAGANPAIEWVESQNIVVGNRYPCSRREIIGGTCTPVIFEFETIDFSDWAKYCF